MKRTNRALLKRAIVHGLTANSPVAQSTWVLGLMLACLPLLTATASASCPRCGGCAAVPAQATAKPDVVVDATLTEADAAPDIAPPHIPDEKPLATIRPQLKEGVQSRLSQPPMLPLAARPSALETLPESSFSKWDSHEYVPSEPAEEEDSTRSSRETPSDSGDDQITIPVGGVLEFLDAETSPEPEQPAAIRIDLGMPATEATAESEDAAGPILSIDASTPDSLSTSIEFSDAEAAPSESEFDYSYDVFEGNEIQPQSPQTWGETGEEEESTESNEDASSNTTSSEAPYREYEITFEAPREYTSASEPVGDSAGEADATTDEASDATYEFTFEYGE